MGRASVGAGMIEPATWPPDEVAALLDDDEDAPTPVDSHEVGQYFSGWSLSPSVLAYSDAIWSCY